MILNVGERSRLHTVIWQRMEMNEFINDFTTKMIIEKEFEKKLCASVIHRFELSRHLSSFTASITRQSATDSLGSHWMDRNDLRMNEWKKERMNEGTRMNEEMNQNCPESTFFEQNRQQILMLCAARQAGSQTGLWQTDSYCGFRSWFQFCPQTSRPLLHLSTARENELNSMRVMMPCILHFVCHILWHFQFSFSSLAIRRI